MIPFFVGFLMGFVGVIALEITLLLFLLNRFLLRKHVQPSKNQMGCDLNTDQSLTFACNKQGAVWVLDPQKVPKLSSQGGSSLNVCKEQKFKKEIVEVIPFKKHASLKGHSLIMTDQDGSKTTICLTGCRVEAVSASNLSSKKWAKRYPIRIENQSLNIYHGSHSCYLYFETSWEKESWCKVLRTASCADKKLIHWYVMLHEEFQQYLTSLIAEYPLFMKPSKIFAEKIDRGGNNPVDGTTSKTRLFLRKLAKRASKSGADTRPISSTSSLRCTERVVDGNMPAPDSLKFSGHDKMADMHIEGNAVPFSSTSVHTGGLGPIPAMSNVDSSVTSGSDEGILLLNMLLSRLFFDAKRNTEIMCFIKSRIQRTLSDIRTPSYIGRISCTDFNIGNLPPYIRNMRVLPMNMKEAWGIEVDIEYSGGFVMDISLRLEVCEPDFRRGVEKASLDSSPSEDVTADLLEGIEYYGKKLKHSADKDDGIEKSSSNAVDLNALSRSKTSNWKSAYATRWKSLLDSISDQVSQVPFSLAIKITSLKGILRLHMKPPPSDQLWFGFTSMPDIGWVLDSAVGDHKINSGHIALLIGNRLKAAIYESLVLPNCGTLCIPWMLAEKDDWIPCEVAPFIWVRQDAAASVKQNGTATSSKQSGGCVTGKDTDSGTDTINSVVAEEIAGNPKDSQDFLLSSRSGAFSELPTYASGGSPSSIPSGESLMQPSGTMSENHDSLSSECLSQSLEMLDYSQMSSVAEDSAAKKAGRRAKMMDIMKKMGEKVEEKRRHFEEKRRHIIDKNF